MAADSGHNLWRCRENELQKDDIPPWKAASHRRDNMVQLSHEWVTQDMEYDMFCYLFDKEFQEYKNVVDGEDPTKGLNSYEDEVAKLMPNYKKNFEKLSSGITAENLLDMDSVKTALEQCKILSEPEEKELKECKNFTIPISRPNDNPGGSKSYGEASGKENFAQKPKQFVYPTSSRDGRDCGSKKKTSAEESVYRSKRKLVEDSEDSEEMETEPGKKFHFKSAREQFEIDRKKGKSKSSPISSSSVKKSLGTRPRNGCFGRFVPPSVKDQKEQSGKERKPGANPSTDMETEIDPRLKGIEEKLIELVTNEIMDHGPPVQWDDIAGLGFAKSTIKEIVIWPMLRPDIFTGLRGPPKGILLFGPPGTGKTLIGKCIASQSGATFFSISASSLTSKWVGEGEKMVRALFAVASCQQPAVIFIDEIDSLLSQRCDTEHESSRRIKTEFLVQLDGAATSSDERILVVGATNRPHEIDEAARRRLSKRLYIPLPEDGARKQIVQSLLEQQNVRLSDDELSQIISETNGFSGADMANLCREAALGPIRSLQGMDISAISKDDVRPIILEDFKKALQRVRPSVSSKDLVLFEEWNKQFGCCAL